jgi:hypothetical protein
VQVTVKFAPITVAGAKFLVNVAVIAELLGTPRVGPGVLVAGLVINTRGRVTSAGVATVVNCQLNGAAIGTPPDRLIAPAMVPVY